MRRPIHLCRSWLFLSGADEAALMAGPDSGADVLIQELEDFTPLELKPKARSLAADIYEYWRQAGVVVAVRINPLNDGGMDDLSAVMKSKPDIVALPMVADPSDVEALDQAVGQFEKDFGIAQGSTRLLPNMEYARGLVQTRQIAETSARVEACLMASEDLAADLGLERSQAGTELNYCRQRFLVECVAGGVVAVDCPYTWQDPDGAEQASIWARKHGYRAKSAVVPAHAEIINRVLSPSEEDKARAATITRAFEQARAAGKTRAVVDGAQIEAPIYKTAKRLLARADEFTAFENARSS